MCRRRLNGWRLPSVCQCSSKIDSEAGLVEHERRLDRIQMSTILDRHVDPQAAEVVRRYQLDSAWRPSEHQPCQSGACGLAGLFRLVIKDT